MYSDAVQRAFDHPGHAGTLSGAVGVAGSEAAGTEIAFRMVAENNRILAMRFQAYGCPHTIAACDLAVERLLGQPVAALRNWDPAGTARELEIPVEKTGRLLLIQDALRNCWQDWDTNRLDSRS